MTEEEITASRVNVLFIDVRDSFEAEQLTENGLLTKINDNMYVIKPGIQVVALKEPVNAEIVLKALSEHIQNGLNQDTV